MSHIKTVLGNIPEQDLGITLAHEHICCYSEYLYQMLGRSYLDKEKLSDVAVTFLKEMKERYTLSTFIDCTPVNIGRNIPLLRQISGKSGVHIICSTGFYYTDEPVLYRSSVDVLADHIVYDAKKVNAGIIKCAVENAELSPFNEKILRATAQAQLKLHLPIVMHSNACNKNGRSALEILLSEGVKPQSLTVGHLSDTEDLAYIEQIAKYGCFIGLDRLHNITSEEYITRKVNSIHYLCDNGYTRQVLLSHDAPFFSGFQEEPIILERPRLPYCFDYILPRLPKPLAEEIMIKNPLRMLKCSN